MRVSACLLLLALAAPAGAAAPEPLPTIAARTAGLERHDGFLPYYWDARAGQLLIEVARPGEQFLYGASLAQGAGITAVFDLDRGALGELGVVRFERVGPRLLLRQEQTTQTSGAPDPGARRAVRESFPSSVRASLPIVAEGGDRVLADATEFLLADTRIVASLKAAQQGDWKQEPARSALAFERSGAFPRNTEIEAELSFQPAQPGQAPSPALAGVLPDGRTLSLRVHHSFLALPEPGYAPRRLDPRIGFLSLRQLDHAAPFTEPLERYRVARWRLEKKDPAASLSEPVRPLVYYLDPGMPEPERTAVREAALWWNHAFEEAGFKDALVIRDLPEGASLLDVRYSGIEWIHRAERGWSVGDSQVDPRTGEILHAVARIDSARRRTTDRMWQDMRPPSPRLTCAVADAPQLSWLAALASPGGGASPWSAEGEREMVLARLRYLAAHEVGHTLGLAHNWAATTFGWGSVMDYLAAHVEIRDGDLDLSDAYPADVGPYDRLTIRWGYTPQEDAAALDRMVRDGYAQGLVYPLEGDARWAEYDFGPDPVAWLRTTEAVRGVILERFGAEQLRPGEPVYDLEVRFSLAYLYHRFAIAAAQREVGGQLQTNALAGDGQTPLAWVPAARQKQALDALLEALAPKRLDIPDRILSVLVPAPNGIPPTRERFPSEAGDAFSLLTAARSLSGLIVDPLLEPERAGRLALASGPDALTLAKELSRLVASTWGAPPDPTPRLASLRRVAQRSVLDGLLDLAASPASSPEARGAALVQLVGLRRDLRLRRSADPAAEAHLRLAERDVAEFLEKPEVRAARPARPAAPPGRPIGR